MSKFIREIGTELKLQQFLEDNAREQIKFADFKNEGKWYGVLIVSVFAVVIIFFLFYSLSDIGVRPSPILFLGLLAGFCIVGGFIGHFFDESMGDELEQQSLEVQKGIEEKMENFRKDFEYKVRDFTLREWKNDD